MKTQLLHLDAHDDTPSTLEKLRWVQADHVVLVWPSHGRILHRRVDLVLLAREAGRQAAQLGVLSHDPDVRAHARQLGLPVFDDLDSVSRRAWPDRPPMPFGARPEPKVLPPRPSRAGDLPNATLTDAQRAGSMLIVIVALLALSIAIGPAAVVELAATERDEMLSIPISLGEEAGPDPLAIPLPSRPLQVEVQADLQLPTTGTVQVPVSASVGAATFINRGEVEVILPEGTGLRTLGPSPQRFETTERALVPAGIGAEVSVPIRASVAGPAGNVPAGSIGAIEGALGLTLTVANPEGTAGGRSESRPGVTSSDLRSLQEALERQLLQAANAELQEQLTQAEALTPGSVVIADVLTSEVRPPQGEPSEVVRGTMSVRVTASALDRERLRREAEAAMVREIGRKRELVPGSVRVELVSNGSGANSAHQAVVRARSRPRVDFGELARSIAGTTTDQAATRLEVALDLAAPPRFRVWPAWWPRLPVLPLRIQPAWVGSPE